MSTDTEIHVGSPADNFRLPESVTVHFHDFQNLTTVQGDKVEAIFSCAGYEWSLSIFPRGNRYASDGMVSVHLQSQSSKKISARCQVSMMTNGGGTYKSEGPGQSAEWRLPNFVARHIILDETKKILNEGTLTFIVWIMPASPTSVVNQTKLNENMLKLFGEDSTADVAFKLGDSMFYGHKLILKVQAPELFQLAEQFDKGTPMPIEDVKPEVFEIMLKYLYGKTIHHGEWKNYSKQILEASDKYGFSELNLNAQTQHTLFMTLTVENAVDELLYADGNNFLHIKKAAIKYIVKNGEAISASSSFPELLKSPELMAEVMTITASMLDGLRS